jgi:uncharacterized membrane protein
MADFSGTTSVSTAPDALFDYLSEVAHLPDYFARMTSASPGDGEEVRTTARMPDGQEVQGDAWFRVDASARRLEWGSEGPSSYAGRLEVRPSGSGSEVEVHLHTTRVEDGDAEVQDGISETLDKIKERAEALPA